MINLKAHLVQKLKDTGNTVCSRFHLTKDELFCMRQPHDAAEGEESKELYISHNILLII